VSQRKVSPQGVAVVVAEGRCRHKWVLETPNGPTSRGVCRLCGEVREFRNYLTSSLWEGTSIAQGSPFGEGFRPVDHPEGDVPGGEGEIAPFPRG